MTDKKAKVVIGVEVDANGVKSGLNEVASSATGMAEKVKRAGAEAGVAVGGIGNGASNSSDKVERATRNMVASIQRATAASEGLGKGPSAMYESLAKLRGVSVDALRPYLDQLDKVSQSQVKTGMSAAAMTNAMRGVPAQFTDIVMSLQGGQAPMTVFLQQGGQLKDMFGGIGPAAKALGGYVLGMVNPFTLAAGGVTALGIAYYQGTQEAANFKREIAASGGAAGLSANQMIALSERIRAVGAGTQSMATESLGAMLSAGNISSGVIENAAIAGLRAQKAFGVSLEDTAEQFSNLAKAPTASVEKLNEKYHFLTLEIYQQIKALEDQGKSAEAAQLAQSSYADAMISRSQKGIDALSDWERGWLRIKKAASGATDAIFDIGREDSSAKKIEALIKDRDRLEGRKKDNATRGEGAYYGGIIDAELAKNEKLINQERAKLDVIKDKAKAIEKSNLATEAGIEFDKEGDKYLSKKAQTLREITKAQNLWLESSTKERPRTLDDKGLADRIAQIHEKNDEKAKAATTRIDKEESAYKSFLVTIKERLSLSDAELVANKALSEGQKLRVKFDADLGAGKIAATAAQKEYARSLIGQIELNGSLESFEKQQLERNKEFAASLRDKALESGRLTKTVDDYVESIKASNELIMYESTLAGKSESERKIAIEQFKIELDLRKEIKKIKETDLGAFNSDKPALIQRASDAAQTRKESIVIQVNTDEITKARKELDAFLDPTKAQTFGDALTGAFKEAGGALQKMSVGLQEYGRSEAEIAKARQNAEKSKLSDPVRYAKDLSAINEKAARSQIQNYAQITGAAKGFFSEGTKGYKALEAAENTFRAIQLASDLVKGVSAAAVGIAGQAQGDPYTALPRMAMMAAAMAGLGFAVGGFGGGDSGGGALAADVQKSQGTGSAFGDAAAKSDSIAKSITEMSKSSGQLLPVNQGMLSALKNIESSMAGFTNLVVRDQGVINGGNLGIQEGQLSKSSVSWNTAILTSGIFAPITKAVASLWGKTTQNIVDSGVSFGGKVSDLQSGKGFNQYASVNTTESSWFGLKKSASNSVQQQALSAELSGQFGLIFSSMGKALSSADEALGGATGRVEESLKYLTISATKVSLKGLSGTALTEALNSVISKSLDEMASAAFPQFDKFREVGEGYAQTVLRVANTFSFVNESFDQINLKLFQVGDSGISAALGFSKLIGGIEELGAVSAGYYKNFFSEVEQNANTMKKITGEFAKQGLGAVPKTRDDYRALVESTSKFGTAEQLASILKLSDAFAQVTPAIDKAAERKRLQDQLDGITTTSVQLLERQRAALDDSNKSLFDQVQAATSAKAAQDALAASTAAMAQKMESAMAGLANSRSSLEVQLLAAQGNQAGADALSRKNDLAGLTAGMSKEDAAKIAASYDYNLALTKQIKALQDAKVAAEQMQSAWQSLTDSIVDEVQRLRGLISGDSSQSASALEAQFASATAGARAGNQDAAKLLPEISRALEQMYSANAQTLQELNFNRAVLAASLEKTAQGNVKYGVKLPSYAVGTDYVSHDQIAQIHEGERITPAAYNRSDATNADLLGEIKMLNTRIAQLLSVNAKTEEHSRQSADILDRVSGGGGAFLTEPVT